MPHDEEVLTQNSVEEVMESFDIVEPQKLADNCVHHQLMSVKTPELGALRAKGEDK